MISAQAASDVGQMRAHNEDTFHVDVERGLFIVADGMGGHAAGEVASKLAVDAAKAVIVDGLRGDEVDASALLTSALLTAHETVLAAAAENPRFEGMGTTMDVVLVRGARAYVAHVGDSRVYRMRAAGDVEQLTVDHTVAQGLVAKGLIRPSKAPMSYGWNILTRALGVEPGSVAVDIRGEDILPGDRFVLCSDGLTDHVDLGVDGPAIIRAAGDAAAAALVDEANERGGRDNITVIIVSTAGVR